MPPEAMPKAEGGFLAKVGQHKGLVIGGVAGLGLLYYLYRKYTAAATPAVAASAASAVGPTSTNPYVGGSAAGLPGAQPGTAGGFTFGGSSAGAFAQTLAGDTASAFAKVYPPGSGPNPASTSNGTGSAASVTNNSTPNTTPPAAQAKPTPSGARNITSPSTVTLKGVRFKPSRTIDVGGVTWYGIPNQPTAASLKTHGVTVKNVLGGGGQYAMA